MLCSRELTLERPVAKLVRAGLGGADHDPAQLEAIEIRQIGTEPLVKAVPDRVHRARLGARVRPQEQRQVARGHLGRVDPVHHDVTQLIGVDGHIQPGGLRALEAEQADQRVAK